MWLSLHLSNASLVVQLQQQLSAGKKKKISMSCATALHLLLCKIKTVINF